MEAEPSGESTELALWQRAQAGDFIAFQQLVERLQPRVYRLAYRILRRAHDAEDATQQTFVALIEHIGDFRGESSLSTWVLRIATNHALKVLRQKRTSRTISVSDLAASADDGEWKLPEFVAPWSQTAEQLVQQQEVLAELDQALATLDDKYRLVFVLRDIEGYSIRDTAALLELNEGTVKVRLLRARLALREHLTRRFGDPTQRVAPHAEHD